MGLSEENRKGGAGVDKVQKGRLIPAGTTVQMLQFTPGANGQQTMLPVMLKLFDFADVPSGWYARFTPAELKHGVIEVEYSLCTASAGARSPIAPCPITCDNCRAVRCTASVAQ